MKGGVIHLTHTHTHNHTLILSSYVCHLLPEANNTQVRAKDKAFHVS